MISGDKTTSENRALTAAGIILASVLFGVSVFLTGLFLWAFRFWAGLTVDEIVFHLNAPIEGTGDNIIPQFLRSAVLPGIFALVSSLFILFAIRRKACARRLRILSAFISLILITGNLIYASEHLSLRTWIDEQNTSSDFIEENYVAPASVKLTFPQKKRNLIYIYLESMEISASDKSSGGAMPENCIPELTALAREGEDFSGAEEALNGGYVMPATTFTMGGMFAQTSGLPLKVGLNESFLDGNGSFNEMNTQESFFPGIMTLGDILKARGYTNVMMFGSDAVFGGRALYFTEHGGYEMDDYAYAKERGWIEPSYRVFWGYEDEKLFANAKTRLLELAAEDKPFNFSMLTVDTHFEDGYVCHLCPDTFGDNQYANVMACSSRQVSDFISWIQDQDFYENTTIILSGDHTTMDSDFYGSIDPSYDRRTYTCVLNPDAVCADASRRRVFTTLDLFPTTLEALGVAIEGDRLGLGTGLFSGTDTLAETYGVEELSGILKLNSPYMRELASLDLFTDSFFVEHIARQTEITLDRADTVRGELFVTLSGAEDFVSVSDSIDVEVFDLGHEMKRKRGVLAVQGDGTYRGIIDIEGLALTDAKILCHIVDDSGKKHQIASLAGNFLELSDEAATEPSMTLPDLRDDTNPLQGEIELP